MAKRQKNKIHLEGIIEQCLLQGEGEKLTADIRFCTAERFKKDGKTVYLNKLRHKVIARLDDPRSQETFKQIAFECRHGNGQAASIDGQIFHKDGERYILSNANKIKLIQAINFTKNNIVELQGTIKKTFFNDAYASIIIENNPSEDSRTFIPIIISKKDNLEKWSEIAARNLYNGDSITISGQLNSHTFSNNEGKQIEDCFINPRSIEKITRKETEKKGIQI